MNSGLFGTAERSVDQHNSAQTSDGLRENSMSASRASLRAPSPIKSTSSAVILIEQFRLRHTIGWMVSATTISLIIAAIVIPWGAFWIALPLGVLFVLLVTVPVYLAIVSGVGDEQTD